MSPLFSVTPLPAEKMVLVVEETCEYKLTPSAVRQEIHALRNAPFLRENADAFIRAYEQALSELEAK